MTREVSAEGRALIQEFEGLSLTAYLCPAGRWTIGYGRTDGVQPGDRITKAHADSLLSADLVSYGEAVDAFVARTLDDGRRLTALTYVADRSHGQYAGRLAETQVLGLRS